MDVNLFLATDRNHFPFLALSSGKSFFSDEMTRVPLRLEDNLKIEYRMANYDYYYTVGYNTVMTSYVIPFQLLLF